MTENHGASRRAWVRSMVAVATGLSAVLTLACTADAATHNPGTPFAAQAKTRVLGTAEAKEGGTQVATDRIRTADEGARALALMAGNSVDSKSTNGTAAIAAGCGYKYFCAYPGPNFTGDPIPMYDCREYYIPWTSLGSWINNQTPGTRAQFRSSDHVTRWTDAGAYDTDASADWSWVYWVKPC
ncbi:hypothetical protein [Streptomyces sp. NBC_01518]|uniref:hypothetical protein n=1 Tax=Streptomyces sp. NBC_01518 TaxID=2903891 RepID=UPI0038691A2E